jgi:hypothetical protein
MVVVADPGLVAGVGALRLDAPHEAAAHERVQHVVHRLVRHRTEADTRRADQGLGVEVRLRTDGVQHREARPGDPQTRPAQCALEVCGVRHSGILTAFP